MRKSGIIVLCLLRTQADDKIAFSYYIVIVLIAVTLDIKLVAGE